MKDFENKLKTLVLSGDNIHQGLKELFRSDLKYEIDTPFKENQNYFYSIYIKRLTSLTEKNVNSQFRNDTEAFINNIKSRDYGEILGTIIISSTKYFLVFTNETVSEIVGVLDATGMGNTSSFLLKT